MLSFAIKAELPSFFIQIQQEARQKYTSVSETARTVGLKMFISMEKV